ncbi:MAG: hypothetical protein DRQ13_12110, partial [Ignavibacteriae bacterium]
MKDYPVIKIAIAFILGILLYKFYAAGLTTIVMLAVISILLYFVALRSKLFIKMKLPLSIALLLLIVSLGNFYTGLNTKEKNGFFENLYKEKNVTAYGIVKKIDLRRSDKINFYLVTDSIKSENFIIKDDITLLCKVKLSKKKLKKLYDELHPGNLIIVSGTYFKGREQRNPGEFDYKEYLLSKGITGILSVSK